MFCNSTSLGLLPLVHDFADNVVRFVCVDAVDLELLRFPNTTVVIDHPTLWIS